MRREGASRKGLFLESLATCSAHALMQPKNGVLTAIGPSDTNNIAAIVDGSCVASVVSIIVTKLILQKARASKVELTPSPDTVGSRSRPLGVG
jgi:hypothetical protein